MRTLPALAVFAAAIQPALALPPNTPIPTAIDHHVDAVLKESQITPAPTADDATLIRRLTLDLAGRIPTPTEVQEFQAATGPDRVEKLVDRLLAAPSYARHATNEFDVLLMANSRGSVRDYLMPAFVENRSWDKIFRDLLLPPPVDDPKKRGGSGPVEYLRSRIKDLDRLTNDVSVTFFGVNVSCAQCHDHPLVDDWKQDHFFGMKSFFARTYEINNQLAEQEYGMVNFKTTTGADRKAQFMFLTGAVADVPPGEEPKGDAKKKEKEQLEDLKKSGKLPPPPAVSARGKLVELALQPGQREYFARAIVNRLWYRLMGYGLVMPLDQLHSENPASHPELLEWLAQDFITHGYDLKRLTRGLVLSKAYTRSSLWEQPSDPPAAHLFAVARVRPLTPTQLGAALKIATADPKQFASDVKPEDRERRVESLEAGGRVIAGQLEQPTENFEVSATEALLFSNADRIHKEFLAENGLVGQLKALKTPAEQVDLAVRSVLCRPASAEETKLLTNFLAARADRPVQACRDMVWALLTSSEFRFNY